MALQDGEHEPLALLLRRDVAGERACSGQLGDQLGEPLRAARCEHRGRARGRKGAGHLRAQAGARPGDEDDLALEAVIGGKLHLNSV
jgi:hypothetical protein